MEARFICPFCSANYGEKSSLTYHLKHKCKKVPPPPPPPPPQPQQQVIYFNEDLKYFTELTGIMGHEGATNYLLYVLPVTKNLFEPLDKIFARDGVKCPFNVIDDGFVISRNEGITEIDPTGALIDLENKIKIINASIEALHAVRDAASTIDRFNQILELVAVKPKRQDYDLLKGRINAKTKIKVNVKPKNLR